MEAVSKFKGHPAGPMWKSKGGNFDLELLDVRMQKNIIKDMMKSSNSFGSSNVKTYMKN